MSRTLSATSLHPVLDPWRETLGHRLGERLVADARRVYVVETRTPDPQRWS